ncbi:hypothetical protein BDK51DRAFT_27043 [Blyttiomyces helicus]|uniref:Uncharacterized protein n=1 Tax=Blyttiomyces helicus TaxID=388810 RepID=A0A4P9WKE9_9FUNG|nr:hypothetical protein BDK51DRAFT_27043 [Blyttiomyces helicus]|eukprot:RKO91640.1 hypothetical protein BDK51DRAFT_27043 [Blyttiomyces helicus]
MFLFLWVLPVVHKSLLLLLVFLLLNFFHIIGLRWSGATPLGARWGWSAGGGFAGIARCAATIQTRTSWHHVPLITMATCPVVMERFTTILRGTAYLQEDLLSCKTLTMMKEMIRILNRYDVAEGEEGISLTSGTKIDNIVVVPQNGPIMTTTHGNWWGLERRCTKSPYRTQGGVLLIMPVTDQVQAHDGTADPSSY